MGGGVVAQWARGNQNVQIADVGAGASIAVTFKQQTRRVPLEPAVIPVGRNVTSPARLLRARSGVLPFVDRGGLLTCLNEWMGSREPFAGYVIGGRGGSGKTRLGVELCVRARQRDWLCGLLSRSAEPAQVEVLGGTPTPRLVVIDYAEARAEQLEVALPWLAERASTEHPVRVLLLIRSPPRRGEDWTEPLRGRRNAELDAVLDHVDVRVLDESPPTPTDRAAIFTSAATAFTGRAHPDTTLETLTVPDPPEELTGPAFANPLLVTVAAYLAVHDPDGTVPTSRADLLTELTGHEDQHWQATAHTQRLDVGDEELCRRVVAVATLAGADTETEAAQLLGLLPDLSDSSSTERCHALARWAHGLYPGPRWWNPLEPDLLGEHLVATHLAGFPQVLAGVLERDDPAALAQPLGLYARAAVDHPAFATALRPVLSAHLEALCGAAIRQAATHTKLDLLLGTSTAAAALDRVLTVITVDPSTVASATNLFPFGADQILGPLSLTLTIQATNYCRLLAAGNPPAYDPALVTALNNLSNRLADAGRRDEGLTAIQDAVQVYRRLAAGNPAAHEPALVMSLNNLSNRLADAGRRDEALTAIQDAVQVCRRLAAGNPAAYDPALASSLNNLSLRLADAGRRDEGLTAIQDAVEIRRRLAAGTPAAYDPDLATSLNNLSLLLADAGRKKESEQAGREAAELGTSR